MNIIWNGPLLDPSGYGKCARDYVKSLHEHFKNVYVQPVRYFNGDPKSYLDKETLTLLNHLMLNKDTVTSDFVHVEHKTPSVFTSINCKKSVGYTVWETDRIPVLYTGYINMKDEIWTASEFSRQALKDSGISIPIYVVPHIIDTEKFNTPDDYERPDNKVRFFFNGEFTSRKGVDTLIKAFLKAFDKEDKVVLYLKTYLLNRNENSKNHEYIRNAIDKWSDDIKPFDPPKIFFTDSILTDDSLPVLYRTVDVFVSATRGEGFGIPIAEAMASKNIVIVPDKGGHMDFCNSNNCLLVSSKQEYIPEGALENDRRIYSGQQWINICEEDLIHTMRTVYKNINDYRQLGERARHTILTHCNSKKIVDLIMERL